jgi:hypothetical protein
MWRETIIALNKDNNIYNIPNAEGLAVLIKIQGIVNDESEESISSYFNEILGWCVKDA